MARIRYNGIKGRDRKGHNHNGKMGIVKHHSENTTKKVN